MSRWLRDIEADLNWREAELASLKLQVVIAPKGSVHEQVLLRALCALLYAHYEGFCKNTWNTYLDAMRKSGVNREDCKDPIALLSAHSTLKEIKSSTTADVWKFCQSGFASLMKEPLDFDVKFETSNLTPKLLREHCELLLIPHDVLDENEIVLKTLINRRHEIAHGQKNIVASLLDYQQYEKATMLVMHELAVSVVDAIDNSLFLK